ncbi:ATP-dependent DNA ligase [Streptomyces nigra]|uniref:ATP-dependent DNA ligase n=1 Tax=Streptomyces nigra TaxID=1827580 RepID=UPI0035DC3750
MFDVLEVGGRELLDRPYRERRAMLEDLFARDVLGAPFTLCPATTDRATALEWLDPAWGEVGIEGVVVKGSEQRYLPGRRAWIKVRSRTTAEGIIGAVTGRVESPSSLLLGRYDDAGRLRFLARTTSLAPGARRELVGRLRAAGVEHPWHGRKFSAGWDSSDELEHQPVWPELVAEFQGDTAVDEGRYRHPVRFVRIRAEMHPMQVPKFGEPD